MSRIKVKIKEQDLNKIREISQAHGNKPGELINVLQQT